MDFVNFREHHIRDIKIKDVYDDSGSREELNKQIIAYQDLHNSHTLTLLDWNEIVAIFGLVSLWPGVVEAWGVTSVHTYKKPIAFHKAVLSVIKEYKEKLDVHRMQITVRSDFDSGIVWANRLGFNYEGLMRRYSVDGTDHLRFARTW